MNNPPFAAQAKTMSVAATQNASTSQALPAIGNSVRVVSAPSGNLSFFSIGTGAQTATVPGANASVAVATSTPVLPGEDVIFTIPRPEPFAPTDSSSPAVNGGSFTAPTPLNVSAICPTGLTATLYLQVNEGN